MIFFSVQGTSEQVQKLLTSLIAHWGNTLSAVALNVVWVRIMWDPFLRQMLLRYFIVFSRELIVSKKDFRVLG